MQRLHTLILLLFILFIPTHSLAQLSEVEKDEVYENYRLEMADLQDLNSMQRQSWFNKQLQTLENSEVKQNLFTKALDEAADFHMQLIWSSIDTSNAPLIFEVQLKSVLNSHKQDDFIKKIIQNWKHLPMHHRNKVCSLLFPKNSQSLLLITDNSLKKNCQDIWALAKLPTRSQLKDLIRNHVTARDFANGRYFKKPQMFQFCREDRRYPCLMLIKNKDGQWVKGSNGQPWSQGKLSLSRLGRKYFEFNGNTPSGVYTIDGVMPQANKQKIYGRYRRLIMQFIPDSQQESLIKSLVPASSRSASWWKESTVARDMGRDLFRIHGTLRINEEKNSSYYPFYPTFGCIASKEGVYDGTDYHEQRHLLDQLMQTSGLQPIYSNETRILGLLYVIDVDDKKKPVTLADLAHYGLSL